MKKKLVEAKKIIFLKINIIIRIRKESKTNLTSIYNSWSIFWKGGTKFSCRKLGYILLTFHWLSQGGIHWKRSPRGTPRMYFALHNGVVPLIYGPTIYFKLMALQNIRKKEVLLSKGASVTMKQTSHPA